MRRPTDKPRVLLVDDEPDMRDFVARVLRHDFQVTRCDSAEQALQILAAEAFDLLITDQKMPRCTGLELIERLGDTQPKLVKILLSGFADAPEVVRALAAGRLHGFVVKPIDAGGLLEAIDAAIAAQAGAAATRPA